jgi:hypothetical protein
MEALATSQSSQGDIEDLTVLVGEEEWSSTNTLNAQDQEALFSLLECSVCVTFLQDAHECPSCHKLFCRDCIGGWLRNASSCPCCRQPATLERFAPNVAIQRFLDNMSVEWYRISSFQ